MHPSNISLELRTSRTRSISHEMCSLRMCGAVIRRRLKSCGVLHCDVTNKCMVLEAADCSETSAYFYRTTRGQQAPWEPKILHVSVFLIFLILINRHLEFNKEVCRSLTNSYAEV